MKEKELVLKVENVSKQYRLGLVGTGTLQDDLKRWWYRIRGKEDPFLKIGVENDRSKKTDDEYVWALKDINFEVKKGEVLGIIGKNGAGKSTLLKLLSKVADPTTGSIKYKGRIAALLEVGTGFHPELTGRENIFLNGAVLGMQKNEIAAKVDEIIEFSGVAQYVDTPVKRYSSGMKVRLGFAVAAHLEPDILIVDEVLAVGDAEFQKKCIGKMQDVAGEGRTVLFVSHNMASVKSLCSKAVLLVNGKVESIGSTEDIVNMYLSDGNIANAAYKEFKGSPIGIEKLKISGLGVVAKNKEKDVPISRNNEIEFKIQYELSDDSIRYDFNLHFKSSDGTYVMNVTSGGQEDVVLTAGKKTALFTIPANMLNRNEFIVDLLIVENKQKMVAKYEDIIVMTISPEEKKLGEWIGEARTILTQDFEWEVS